MELAQAMTSPAQVRTFISKRLILVVISTKQGWPAQLFPPWYIAYSLGYMLGVKILVNLLSTKKVWVLIRARKYYALKKAVAEIGISFF